MDHFSKLDCQAEFVFLPLGYLQDCIFLSDIFSFAKYWPSKVFQSLSWLRHFESTMVYISGLRASGLFKNTNSGPKNKSNFINVSFLQNIDNEFFFFEKWKYRINHKSVGKWPVKHWWKNIQYLSASAFCDWHNWFFNTDN